MLNGLSEKPLLKSETRKELDALEMASARQLR